jgi:cytochrome c-type biogenesis protein
MNRKTALVSAAVAIAVVAVLLVAYFSYQSPVASKPAPGFAVTDTAGTPFNLSGHKGDVVVLELTAINCPTCSDVLKALKTVNEKYKDRRVMLSVFVSPIETEEQVRAYHDSHGVNWSFAKDTENRDLFVEYSAVQIPKVVVIDKMGGILYETTGVVTEGSLSPHIDDALAGKTGQQTAGGAFIASLGLGGMAVLAGVASYFSPCSFPMLPGYMTYYLRDSQVKESYGKAAAGGAVAGMGIMTVYGVIGVIAVAAGSVVTKYVTYLQPIIGVVLLVLGVLMLTPLQFFNSGKFTESMQNRMQGKGYYFGLYLYGVAYGAASQGCTAPVFIAVILIGFLSGSLLTGIGVLLLYSLTAALLMVVVTVLVAGLKKGVLSKLKAQTENIKKASAVVLIIVGCYLVGYYLVAFVL